MGATGATGKHLVSQLLDSGVSVKAIVRSENKLPEAIRDHSNFVAIEGSVLDISDEVFRQHVDDCNAIVSCLGHNLNFKGIYGKPRKLVRDAARKACEAVKLSNSPGTVKFILMNTTGNRNKDMNETVSFKHKVVVALLRLILPPHPDNEQAAEYLRSGIGKRDHTIEWVVVRPDGLIDDDSVSDYTLHQSPTRDAIFNAGKTSRINVANFMARLATENDLWNKWKGQMPVIYNSDN